MIDHLSIVRASGAAQVFVPKAEEPTQGRLFGRIRHDVELYGVGRPDLTGAPASSSGLPETVKCSDFKKVERAWQEYWYAVMVRRMPTSWTEEQRIKLFGTVTRRNAFKTNQHACENGFANYITGCNTGAKPLMTEVIVTGGACVEILDGGAIQTHVGEPCYRFRTLDATKPPPNPADWDGVHQTWFLYFATTSLRGGTAYPLLGGCDIVIPNLSDREYEYVPAVRVELLPQGVSTCEPYYNWP